MSEGRYRALLCLVQIAVDDDTRPAGEPRIELIDSLESGVDVTPLAQLLADPAIEVVLHAGRQDVAILRRAWATEVNNIFDTQLAAGFAGASAQTGYGNLLGSMLGRRVGKTASYTRWDARPLTAEQLSYAAEDVAHLLELADEVQRRLETDRPPQLGLRGVPAPRVRDRRARPLYRLGAASARRAARPASARGGARAGGLARANRVRRGSAGRVRARRSGARRARQAPPLERGALEQIRGIHPSGIRRRGAQILEAIAAGMKAEPIPREEPRGRSEPDDVPLIVLAEALLRARSLEAGLAYELIASRNELELIVAASRRREAEPDVRTLEGWRSELVGADLRDLLAGRKVVSVGPDRRLVLGDA